MNRPNYLSCRCLIDFAENKDVNFLSFNYDEEFIVNVKGEKARLGDKTLYQYGLDIVGNINKAKFAILVPNLIELILVNVLLTSIQSVFVFRGFFSFGADYWKYMLYQMTFLSTLIVSSYNLFWAIFSRKKQLNYYGRISSTINSFRPQKCNFLEAKKSVLAILDNNHIYGCDDCFKKLPFKNDYIDKLKVSVANTKNVSQYEYEYNKTLSLISNRGSLLFAVVGILISALVQIFAFLDTWNSVGNEFHLNMIVTTVVLSVVAPLILFSFISNSYHNRIMRLESLYCLYSYQYLDMPYSKKVHRSTFDFGKYKNHGIQLDEEFLSNFIKAFNESSIYKISIRDIDVNDNYKLIVFGFAKKDCDLPFFKEILTAIYSKFDAIYLR